MASPELHPQEKLFYLLENVFNYINRKVIALEDKDVKRNNVLLTVITDKLIGTMQQKSVLFKTLYKSKYYGGSYYDNLKVGEPNEYDLDLVLRLPVRVGAHVTCSDQPGFVHVRIQSLENMRNFVEEPDFLSASKLLEWFEGVFSKALNKLEKDVTNGRYVDVVLDSSKPLESTRVYLNVIKGVPAFTLNVTGENLEGSEIKIDLVPCFQFDDCHWPDRVREYLPNSSTKKSTFLVVPKKPKEQSAAQSKYWRLSFQEQERELIGNGKKHLKPALRLMKKLRDKYQHNVASYFIKTVYLLAVEQMDETFWSKPVGLVFITMLKEYEKLLRQNCIPYYWNRNYNLIGRLKRDNNQTIANTLKHVIDDVERGLTEHPVNYYAVAKHLLTNEEYEKLRLDLPLTEKQTKHARNVHARHFIAKGLDCSSTSPLEGLGFSAETRTLVEWFTDRWENADGALKGFL